MHDVIIVGGGPAGLSAALVLGRCLRPVLVCDAGQPRNRDAPALHGYLTRDGMPPGEFLAQARRELARYSTIELRQERVRRARRQENHFEVETAQGWLPARRLVLATGVVDEPPPLPGLIDLFGRGVFHCPYCDGWEYQGAPLAAQGKGHGAVGLALALTRWSEDVVLCTDGPSRLSGPSRDRLNEHGIPLYEERVERLEGDGRLERIVLEGGPVLQRRALFFASRWRQASDLPAQLGCSFTRSGVVRTQGEEAIGVPGLFVVGDASVAGGMVVIAAAEGAKAGVAINEGLHKEDLTRTRVDVDSPLSN